MLVVAVLPGADDVSILRLRKRRDQLSIDAIQGLKAKAIGSSLKEAGHQVAIRRIDIDRDAKARHMPVSLSAVH